MKRKKIVNGVIMKVRVATGNLCCVKCRFTAKGNYGKCPHCHERMMYMGYKFRMPKKSNDKEWKKLKEKEMVADRKELEGQIKKAKIAYKNKEELHF